MYTLENLRKLKGSGVRLNLQKLLCPFFHCVHCVCWWFMPLPPSFLGSDTYDVSFVFTLILSVELARLQHNIKFCEQNVKVSFC